jgi:ankyrin repeat protein
MIAVRGVQVRDERQILAALLSANATLDAADPLGCTALMHAADIGARHAVAALLQAGADVNTAAADGTTSLMLASGFSLRGQRRHIGVVEALLLAGADANAAKSDGGTALIAAVDVDAADVVVALLTAGAQPSLADAEGVTPLHKAAGRGNIGIMKKLLAAGAQLEARTESGSKSDLSDLSGALHAVSSCCWLSSCCSIVQVASLQHRSCAACTCDCCPLLIRVG